MNLPPAQLRLLVCEVRDGALWPICIAEGGEFVSGAKAAPIAARPTMLALKAMLGALTPGQSRELLNELNGTQPCPEAIPELLWPGLAPLAANPTTPAPQANDF